jgi:hypothetical protein
MAMLDATMLPLLRTRTNVGYATTDPARVLGVAVDSDGNPVP